MKKLPKSLYAKLEKHEGDEPFIIASDGIDGLGINIGDTEKIGLYKLVGTYEAEGMIETSKFKSIKRG